MERDDVLFSVDDGTRPAPPLALTLRRLVLISRGAHRARCMKYLRMPDMRLNEHTWQIEIKDICPVTIYSLYNHILKLRLLFWMDALAMRITYDFSPCRQSWIISVTFTCAKVQKTGAKVNGDLLLINKNVLAYQHGTLVVCVINSFTIIK